LSTALKFPFKIQVTSIGFLSKEVNVASANKSVVLREEDNLLNEIVVSASRTPERIIESPVTIERMGVAEIKRQHQLLFYDGLENLKKCK
jgi:phosphoenolpyruvate synthase/pyruvate phosphate dikinase